MYVWVGGCDRESLRDRHRKREIEREFVGRLIVYLKVSEQERQRVRNRDRDSRGRWHWGELGGGGVKRKREYIHV